MLLTSLHGAVWPCIIAFKKMMTFLHNTRTLHHRAHTHTHTHKHLHTHTYCTCTAHMHACSGTTLTHILKKKKTDKACLLCNLKFDHKLQVVQLQFLLNYLYKILKHNHFKQKFRYQPIPRYLQIQQTKILVRCQFSTQVDKCTIDPLPATDEQAKTLKLWSDVSSLHKLTSAPLSHSQQKTSRQRH